MVGVRYSPMATRKTAATKVAPTISPEPDPQEDSGGGQNCPMPSPPPAPPAPAPAPAGTGTPAPAAASGSAKSSLPSSITIAVGEAGYYTGARPVETLAAYDARMGASANTFADLGWILGTKPKV